MASGQEVNTAEECGWVSSIAFGDVLSTSAYRLELERNELEALLLKALDDLTNESTLDAIRLDHNVGTLAGHGEVFGMR